MAWTDAQRKSWYAGYNAGMNKVVRSRVIQDRVARGELPDTRKKRSREGLVSSGYSYRGYGSS